MKRVFQMRWVICLIGALVLIAGLVMLLLWSRLPGKPPQGSDLGKTALIGVLVFAVGMRFQIAATHIGRAGDVSLLVALQPLIVAVAAAFFLSERIAMRRWLGFLFGISGVVLMAEVWRPESSVWRPLYGISLPARIKAGRPSVAKTKNSV